MRHIPTEFRARRAYRRMRRSRVRTKPGPSDGHEQCIWSRGQRDHVSGAGGDGRAYPFQCCALLASPLPSAEHLRGPPEANHFTVQGTCMHRTFLFAVMRIGCGGPNPPPPPPSGDRVEPSVSLPPFFADAHTGALRSVLESANPAWTWGVHLDAPGQRHGQQPVSGTADPRSSQTGQVIRGLR